MLHPAIALIVRIGLPVLINSWRNKKDNQREGEWEPIENFFRNSRCPKQPTKNTKKHK